MLREGPDEPYYFGLTTPANTHAYFGVNCDMPGLHFEVPEKTPFPHQYRNNKEILVLYSVKLLSAIMIHTLN